MPKEVKERRKRIAKKAKVHKGVSKAIHIFVGKCINWAFKTYDTALNIITRATKIVKSMPNLARKFGVVILTTSCAWILFFALILCVFR